MTTDSYVYVITALLPLAASILIVQVNPYRALVIRGILGAVAAMVYTVLGAADVALTEALVGTLLAITLYAVAVRSSLVLRLGVLKDEAIALEEVADLAQANYFRQLMDELRIIFSKRHMQVELVPYLNHEDLHQALTDKEVHATCMRSEPQDQHPYHTITRLRRVYDIIKTEMVSPLTDLSYISASSSKEAHL